MECRIVNGLNGQARLFKSKRRSLYVAFYANEHVRRVVCRIPHFDAFSSAAPERSTALDFWNLRVRILCFVRYLATGGKDVRIVASSSFRARNVRVGTRTIRCGN